MDNRCDILTSPGTGKYRKILNKCGCDQIWFVANMCSFTTSAWTVLVHLSPVIGVLQTVTFLCRAETRSKRAVIFTDSCISSTSVLWFLLLCLCGPYAIFAFHIYSLVVQTHFFGAILPKYLQIKFYLKENCPPCYLKCPCPCR